LALCSSCWSW